jgi:serine/threonine-protein kinase
MPPTVTPHSITPAPTSGIGSTKISADGTTMVYVPAGKFRMGSSDVDLQASDNEKPIHTVDLDAFWIDKFEVTNVLYKRCVEAGKCTAPAECKSWTRNSYYGNSQYDNYPVINVTWENATQYCSFANKRLPTEAQWEKAARGTDGSIYPWADLFDVNKLNSSEGGKGDTTPVGSYPSGASPYGAMDMAGNVWEWIADGYDSGCYKNSQMQNPIGPPGGQFRVVRGGSWRHYHGLVRAASRYGAPPGYSYDSVGFRCVE